MKHEANTLFESSPSHPSAVDFKISDDRMLLLSSALFFGNDGTGLPEAHNIIL